MDRVLVISEDIQYVSHLEMTLRKVGFDVESITNEYNLQEKLLSYNPDYIVAKGEASRASAQNIGKKLKENSKFTGKIVLVFSENQQSSPEDFIKLRMDLLLFEPIGAMKLVSQLLTLTQFDKEAMFERLMKYALTDNQFRNNENQILKKLGQTVDSEMQLISSAWSRPAAKVGVSEVVNESDVADFAKVKSTSGDKSGALHVLGGEDQSAQEAFVVTEEYKNQLKNELTQINGELPLRIDSYNQVIKTINQDLKKGLSKRITKAANKNMYKDVSEKDLTEQDEERKKFVKALMKK